MGRRLALLWLAVPAVAAADSLSSIEARTPADWHGGGGAQATVVLSATLETAVAIELRGATDGAATTTIAGSGASGRVAFGAFDTLCSSTPQNGECVRVAGPASGAHLVASFVATVRVSGASGANLSLTRDAPAGAAPPDLPAARLKFAPGADTSWADSAAGTPLAAPLAAGAEGNLGAGLPSLTAVPHQIGMFFPDGAPPGEYTTAVRWTATAE